jgi:hypothetical protein
MSFSLYKITVKSGTIIKISFPSTKRERESATRVKRSPAGVARTHCLRARRWRACVPTIPPAEAPPSERRLWRDARASLHMCCALQLTDASHSLSPVRLHRINVCETLHRWGRVLGLFIPVTFLSEPALSFYSCERPYVVYLNWHVLISSWALSWHPFATCKAIDVHGLAIRISGWEKNRALSASLDSFLY